MTYGNSFKPNSLLGLNEQQIGSKRETNLHLSNRLDWLEPMRKLSNSSRFREEVVEPWMCIDYHVKGNCMRGDKCNYAHDQSVTPPEKKEEESGRGGSTSEKRREEQAASPRVAKEDQPTPPKEKTPSLEEIFHSILDLNPFKRGHEQVDKIRPSLVNLRGVFVLLKNNPRPAVICREMLRNPEKRDGRAGNVKNLACLQFGIEKQDDLCLMVDVQGQLTECIDSLVSFQRGETAETLYLVPSSSPSCQ